MIKKDDTIVVIGGAGFVGSHLIEGLVSDGYTDIISLDNYFTGTADNHVEGATYITGSSQDIEEHITKTPRIIFHLGEYSRVEKSFDEPDTVWDLNCHGTFKVVEFCRKHGSKLVYAGSSTKFGDGGLGRDQSPYAWTKAVNTELVRNYGDWYGVPYAITYFYNVYGPREISTGPYATVIGIFKELHRKNEPLTVVSPGLQQRNFTHVVDIVRGLIQVGCEGSGDGYGLGCEKSYSILDIATMFGGKVEMLPERKGNRITSIINTSKMKTEFSWVAKENIEDYIHSITKK